MEGGREGGNEGGRGGREGGKEGKSVWRKVVMQVEKGEGREMTEEGRRRGKLGWAMYCTHSTVSNTGNLSSIHSTTTTREANGRHPHCSIRLSIFTE